MSFRTEIIAEAWVKENPMAIPPFFNWQAMGSVEDRLSGKTMKYSKTMTRPNIFKVENSDHLRTLQSACLFEHFLYLIPFPEYC